MFVTTQPGRIVDAKALTVSSGKEILAGADGLFTRFKVLSGNSVISHAANTDPSVGYALSAGEVIEFSGLAKIYNSGTSDTQVYCAIFDTI